MTYIRLVYNNICCFVLNIMYFSPYEFITTIKNIPSVLFNSKINLISNIYTCFDIDKIFDNIYKPKNIQNTQHTQQKKFRTMNYSNNISNHCEDNDIEDNDIEDNCDWGWFVAIDEFEVHKK